MIPNFRLLGKLGKRLFYLFGLSSMIPMLIMAIQGYHCAHRAVGQSARVHLLSFVESQKKQLTHWIFERAENIYFLAQFPCLQMCTCYEGKNSHHVCNIANTLCQRFPEFENIYIFDREKKQSMPLKNFPCSLDKSCHAPQDQLLEAKEIPKALYLAASNSKQPVFGNVYHIENVPGIHIACTVPDEHGVINKILWAEVNMEKIIHRLLDEKKLLGKSGRIMFFNVNGESITKSSQEIAPSYWQKIKNDIDTMAGKQTGIIENSMLLAFARLESLNLFIIAELSWHEAMAELLLFLKFSLFTMGSSLIVVSIIAGIIAKKLSDPILKLTTATRCVAQGDLSQRVSYRRHDEIGMLVEDFNCMVHQLEATQHRLIQTEALATTGKMVASIVHEIRNPLSSIKMNLQILTRRMEKEERYKEHGNIALQELSHLEDMLSELLDLSRPMQLELQRIEIGDLIKESLQSIAAKILQNQIIVKHDISSCPFYLIIDGKRFKQALCNLILNAIQASQPQQPIIIRAYAAEDSSRITIEISDEGEGITEENMAQIFNPFFTTRNKGTGLGLSQVKKIVELHDGSISVESKPGIGSTFRIVLPQPTLS